MGRSIRTRSPRFSRRRASTPTGASVRRRSPLRRSTWTRTRTSSASSSSAASVHAAARGADEVVADVDDGGVLERLRLDEGVARVDADRIGVGEDARLGGLAEARCERDVDVARRLGPAGDRARGAVADDRGGDLLDDAARELAADVDEGGV